MSIPSFSNSKLLHFTLFIALTAQSSLAAATAWENWFLNRDQQADRAFKQGDYEQASELFTQPYQKATALYRAGKYKEAAEIFSQIDDPEQRLNAQYNLANAEFKQNEFAKAIAHYESVLTQDPHHSKAQHNLELAKAKLKEQEQKAAHSDSDSDENKKNEENSDSGDNSDKNNQNGQNDPNQTQAGDSPKNQQAKDSNEPSSSAESSENGQNSPDPTAMPQPESSPSEANKNGQQALQEQLEQALAEAQQQAQDNQPSTQTSEEKQNVSPSASESAGENGQITQTEAIPTGETTDTTKTTANLPQEQDLMADALLNQLLDDPGVLLQQQFQLDAYHSQEMPSGQPW
ncbi:tetratricopeptide repeat protein [Thioflexithrix psekupsensis]|uniref:Uncharacterized protein n=1 Tax=Thioflexithrix psekupsensis TaxID=1570016 RepID=A0A251X6Q5_9GAMM|nr:tetratricopeptide repeat protein [Thioflexithrix psekupsensis]OUD13277.1 hypothetical protein TPSD3_11645 [Thioflexithrix psekupsensis]